MRPVAVAIDGHPVLAYQRAYDMLGHVYAPVRPFTTAIADRIWLDGHRLFFQRGDRRVSVRLAGTAPTFDDTVVALAPIARALGATVSYHSRNRRLDIELPPRQTVSTPTPFDTSAPQRPPTTVFTPQPVATPRPIWTGSPLPRRTPLPYASPADRGRMHP
jgi:hypothetical protein